MQWELLNDRPVYLQLAEQIKLRLVLGIYPPGEKLPGVRDLAAEAAVNPNTMQRALGLLEQEGLLFSQRTSGRFVTEDGNKISDIKKQLAKSEVKQFITRMGKLGYTADQARELFEEWTNEEGEGIEE